MFTVTPQTPPLSTQARATGTILLSRYMVFGLLFSVYAFAFLVLPYWRTAPLGLAEGPLFCLLATAGLAWAYLASGPLQLSFRRTDAILLCASVSLLLILQWHALHLDIAWKGDEDYHIGVAIQFAKFLYTNNGGLLLLFLACMMAFLLALRLRTWLALCPLAGMLAIAWYMDTSQPFLQSIILRYPGATRWLHALPPVLAGMSGSSPYHEVFYRIVPFASSCLLAWTVSRTAGRGKVLPGLLWVGLVATIPLISYYSAKAYLEMPAVLLLSVACLDLPHLLQAPPNQLKTRISWYALVGSSFIKETVLPFVAIIILFRFLAQRQKDHSRSLLTTIRQESGQAVGVLFPVAVYLIFRSLTKMTMGTSRSVLPNLDQLSWRNELLLWPSTLWEYMGPLLILAAVGFVILCIWKHYLLALPPIVLPVSYMALITMEDPTLSGYARFSLLFIPPVLYLATHWFDGFKVWKQSLPLVLLPAIALNVWLSPYVGPWETKNDWGSPFKNWNEYTYPYTDALAWLKHNRPEKRLLITGMDYNFFWNFPFAKLHWRKEYATINMSRDKTTQQRHDIFNKAQKSGIDIILFHRPPADASQDERIGGYAMQQSFCHGNNCLLVYEKE